MIFEEPFLHIIKENAVENPIELAKEIYDSTEWIPDIRPDLCPAIFSGQAPELLSEFETKEQAEYLFNTFKIDIPENYVFASDFQLQQKGGQLEIHTVYNQIAYDVYKEELNLDVIHSITQHIYLPDTDQHPETGAIFHKKQKGSILPVKQIKCLPGTYFAYVNSEISFHSVPIQKDEFNRIVWVSRLIW